MMRGGLPFVMKLSILGLLHETKPAGCPVDQSVPHPSQFAPRCWFLRILVCELTGSGASWGGVPFQVCGLVSAEGCDLWRAGPGKPPLHLRRDPPKDGTRSFLLPLQNRCLGTFPEALSQRLHLQSPRFPFTAWLQG